jgi:hypothetical protein
MHGSSPVSCAPRTLPTVWRVLSECHDLRNLGEYEGDLTVDERMVDNLVCACRAVAAQVDALPPIKD